MSKDKKKKKEKTKLKGTLLIYIFSVIIGAVIGVVWAETSIREGNNPELINGDFFIWLLALYAFLCISLYIQIIVHEFGHFVFGKLSGYTLSTFRIGSMAFINKNGTIVRQKLKIPGTAGQCLMNPPEVDPYNVPFFLYNMGGVFANLISFIIFLILYLVFPAIPYLNEFFALMAIISLLMALTNGIPINTQMTKNDGGYVKELLQNLSARRDFWLQLKINNHFMEDTRLKDMPKEWFILTGDMEKYTSLNYSIGVFAFSRLLDELEIEKAKEFGQMLLEKGTNMAGIHKKELECELLFCEILLNENIEDAKIMYTKDLRKFVLKTTTNISRLRLLYAYHLLIEKDEKKAQKFLDQFNKKAEKHPILSEVKMERELLALIAR